MDLVVLLAAYLAPVAVLWWLYRVYLKRRGRLKADSDAAAEAIPEPGGTPPPPARRGMSFPIGVPLVVYPLLLWGIVRGQQQWWGWLLQVAYFGLLVLFSWEGLSRREYEAMRTKDATLSRATWVLNWLLFFVVLPLGAWVLVVLA